MRALHLGIFWLPLFAAAASPLFSPGFSYLLSNQEPYLSFAYSICASGISTAHGTCPSFSERQVSCLMTLLSVDSTSQDKVAW
ncbi:hypothetical protein [Parasitella parasitica]|uniref:Secreted protein n=1 Tax=Parasitella parasitica TaxID=35722 RepID=A0A0B7NPB6_9FUNG|nr:hypothetical protein [Parasitella parasitica]